MIRFPDVVVTQRRGVPTVKTNDKRLQQPSPAVSHLTTVPVQHTQPHQPQSPSLLQTPKLHVNFTSKNRKKNHHHHGRKHANNHNSRSNSLSGSDSVASDLNVATTTVAAATTTTTTTITTTTTTTATTTVNSLAIASPTGMVTTQPVKKSTYTVDFLHHVGAQMTAHTAMLNQDYRNAMQKHEYSNRMRGRRNDYSMYNGNNGNGNGKSHSQHYSNGGSNSDFGRYIGSTVNKSHMSNASSISPPLSDISSGSSNNSGRGSNHSNFNYRNSQLYMQSTQQYNNYYTSLPAQHQHQNQQQQQHNQRHQQYNKNDFPQSSMKTDRHHAYTNTSKLLSANSTPSPSISPNISTTSKNTITRSGGNDKQCMDNNTFLRLNHGMSPIANPPTVAAAAAAVAAATAAAAAATTVLTNNNSNNSTSNGSASTANNDNGAGVNNRGSASLPMFNAHRNLILVDPHFFSGNIPLPDYYNLQNVVFTANKTNFTHDVSHQKRSYSGTSSPTQGSKNYRNNAIHRQPNPNRKLNTNFINNNNNNNCNNNNNNNNNNTNGTSNSNGNTIYGIKSSLGISSAKTQSPPDRFLERLDAIELPAMPPIALCNQSSWDKLSLTIWRKCVERQQTKETYRNKMLLWWYMIDSIEPFELLSYSIYMVGSTISGFGLDTSDVDMCLVSRYQLTNYDSRNEAMMHLSKLGEHLQQLSIFKEFNLIQAKVPILRFKDDIHKVEIDLNFNNCVGIRNTHLLHCYSRMDWRLRPLALIVKIWAQFHYINNAKDMTISSYSLILMVIHFLQYAVQPPVLPCLHAMHPDKFLNEIDISTIDMNEDIEPYQSDNKQMLGELFLQFLEYYSSFNYEQNAISVRTACVLPIEECRNVRSLKNEPHAWTNLCIEEPFDLTNTARSCYDEKIFERIKSVFVTSWHVLRDTMELERLFDEPFLAPPPQNMQFDNLPLAHNYHPLLAMPFS